MRSKPVQMKSILLLSSVSVKPGPILRGWRLHHLRSACGRPVGALLILCSYPVAEIELKSFGLPKVIEIFKEQTFVMLFKFNLIL